MAPPRCVTFGIMYREVYLYITGWSFIGKKLSKSIPIKVLVKQIHTNQSPIIGNNLCVKQINTKKAPTNKGESPHDLWPCDIIVKRHELDIWRDEWMDGRMNAFTIARCCMCRSRLRRVFRRAALHGWPMRLPLPHQALAHGTCMGI